MKKLTRTNTEKERHAAGLYMIYSQTKRLEYVGSSKDIKHRISSYHQKDDFGVNRTKRALRPHARLYRVQYMSIESARRKEKILKIKAPHNKSVARGSRTLPSDSRLTTPGKHYVGASRQ